ncbi:MAG: hypothetical protein ACR2JK_09530 [Geodermatophilaceae bacterium]
MQTDGHNQDEDWPEQGWPDPDGPEQDCPDPDRPELTDAEYDAQFRRQLALYPMNDDRAPGQQAA